LVPEITNDMPGGIVPTATPYAAIGSLAVTNDEYEFWPTVKLKGAIDDVCGIAVKPPRIVAVSLHIRFQYPSIE
jgi:hypothetical protein